MYFALGGWLGSGVLERKAQIPDGIHAVVNDYCVMKSECMGGRHFHAVDVADLMRRYAYAT